MKFKIVDKTKYELLEKMAQRIDNYIMEIKILGKKVEENNDRQASILKEIDIIKEELNTKEQQRKKLACKIGGLKTSLNNQKEKNDTLLNLNKVLIKENIKQKEELKEMELKLNFLANNKRTPSLEDYKNYIERRKECEKRIKK